MEQVEGGDLLVNRGNESRPKDSASEVRDLNAVEGLEAAIKLAQVGQSDLTRVGTTELIDVAGGTRHDRQEQRATSGDRKSCAESYDILLRISSHPTIHLNSCAAQTRDA